MEAEPMPVVNPADLAAVFDFYRDLQSQYGGVPVAYFAPPERLEGLCSPGADIEAISTRAVFLHCSYHASSSLRRKDGSVSRGFGGTHLSERRDGETVVDRYVRLQGRESSTGLGQSPVLRMWP